MIPGLFGRMTTDDSEENIHRENMVNATEAMRQVNENIRNNDLRQVDSLLEEEMYNNTQTKIALTKTKNSLQNKERENFDLIIENEKLKAENEALRQTAINIAIDRRAIFNTIEYLNKKWGKNAPRSPENQVLVEKGHVVLFDEAESIRNDEERRMVEDDAYVAEVSKKIDIAAKRKIKKK